MRHLDLAVTRIEEALHTLSRLADASDDAQARHVRHARDVLVHALDRLRFLREPAAWAPERKRA